MIWGCGVPGISFREKEAVCSKGVLYVMEVSTMMKSAVSFTVAMCLILGTYGPIFAQNPGGTYMNLEDGKEYLTLNPDGTFFLKQRKKPADLSDPFANPFQTITGTYLILGEDITLRLPGGGRPKERSGRISSRTGMGRSGPKTRARSLFRKRKRLRRGDIVKGIEGDVPKWPVNPDRSRPSRRNQSEGFGNLSRPCHCRSNAIHATGADDPLPTFALQHLPASRIP